MMQTLVILVLSHPCWDIYDRFMIAMSWPTKPRQLGIIQTAYGSTPVTAVQKMTFKGRTVNMKNWLLL